MLAYADAAPRSRCCAGEQGRRKQAGGQGALGALAGTQLTCFAGTKVQTLIPEALPKRWQERKKREEEAEEAARNGQTETEKQDAVEQTVHELGLMREGTRDKAARQKKPEQIAKIDRRIAAITKRLAHAEARYQAVALLRLC
jgi:hypothetical protein